MGTTRPVGVVGLGPMGVHLALRLAAAGFAVRATSRSAATREAAARAGVAVVTDAEQLGEWLVGHARPVVVTSLPAGAQVREALLGADGVLGERTVSGWTLVDTSTCAPADARTLAQRLAERGMGAVDAPVSGGPTAARDGVLSVMAGGAADDLAAADPVLRALAGRLVVCGGPGAGQIAKACNQLVVTANIAVVAEALVTASVLGADPAAVREALLGGYASSRILELHGARMLDRDFSLGAAVRTQVKDIGIIRELTGGVVDNAVFEAAARIMTEAVDEAGSDVDHSAAVTVVERRAGHRLGDGE